MTGAVLHFLTNTSMWLQASSDIHQCMVPGVFWCIVPKHTSLSLLRRFHWLWWVRHWCLQLISHVPYHHLMLVSAPPLICSLPLPPSLLRCFHQLWQNWHWCRTISPVIAVSIDCGMSDVGVCASSHLFITTTSVIAKVFPLTLAGLTLVLAPHLACSLPPPLSLLRCFHWLWQVWRWCLRLILPAPTITSSHQTPSGNSWPLTSWQTVLCELCSLH